MSVSSPPVIQLRKLTKRYGKGRGIENVNITVNQGEIFGFLGPNGAGKTTTINLLLDIIRPTSGQIKLFGKHDVKNNAELRRNIGFLSGDMELYEHLTGQQYIALVGRISKNLDEDKLAELEIRLQADLSKKIKTLSRGNKQKIGLIATLARSTKLLILDEPTSGLDPLIQQEFNELIREYQKNGGTVFISSHILSEVQTLCDRVMFIKEGKIVTSGKVHDLMKGIKKRVMVRAAPSVLHSIQRMRGISDFHSEGEVARFEITGNLSTVLTALPLQKIEDITISPPDLEELFMHYYEPEKEAKK